MKKILCGIKHPPELDDLIDYDLSHDIRISLPFNISFNPRLYMLLTQLYE